MQYKTAGGEPTRKLVYQATTGVPTGVALAAIIGYFIGRLDPTIPTEIVGLMAGLIAAGLTSGALLVVGWLTRPAARDKPVVDEATLPQAPPGIPPE